MTEKTKTLRNQTIYFCLEHTHMGNKPCATCKKEISPQVTSYDDVFKMILERLQKKRDYHLDLAREPAGLKSMHTSSILLHEANGMKNCIQTIETMRNENKK